MRKLVLFLILIPAVLLGQTAAARTAALHLGFSRDRLARIDAFLQESGDSNRIAGVVALVLRDGHVVYERAA